MDKNNIIEDYTNIELICGFCNRKVNQSPRTLFFKSEISDSCICDICSESFFKYSKNFLEEDEEEI